MNWIHTFTPCLFNTHFNIIFPFTSGSHTTRIQFTLFELSKLLTRLSSLREGCGYIVCHRAHFFLKTEAVRSTKTSVNFYQTVISYITEDICLCNVFKFLQENVPSEFGIRDQIRITFSRCLIFATETSLLKNLRNHALKTTVYRTLWQQGYNLERFYLINNVTCH